MRAGPSPTMIPQGFSLVLRQTCRKVAGCRILLLHRHRLCFRHFFRTFLVTAGYIRITYCEGSKLGSNKQKGESQPASAWLMIIVGSHVMVVIPKNKLSPNRMVHQLFWSGCVWGCWICSLWSPQTLKKPHFIGSALAKSIMSVKVVSNSWAAYISNESCIFMYLCISV